MMHRCSSSCHGNSQSGDGGGGGTSGFSMFFPTAYSYDYESAVDCTLSLGTPSTRVIATENEKPKHSNPGNKSGRNPAADSLVARRCANCDTTSTPLWRNGPRGPKSLCNACGIRFKKEERRARAAAAATGGGGTNTQQRMTINNSWVPHMVAYYPSAYGNEYRFIDGDYEGRDSGAGNPFISWRLNVADRPSLVNGFTT